MQRRTAVGLTIEALTPLPPAVVPRLDIIRIR